MGLGLYAGVDYKLNLCPLQNRLQLTCLGQLYARVYLSPMTEPTLSPQSGTLNLASEDSNF
jgi:hypothetical protein